MLVLKTDPTIRGAENKTLSHNNRQASNKLAQTPNQKFLFSVVFSGLKSDREDEANLPWEQTELGPQKGAQSSLSPNCDPQEVKPGMSTTHLALIKLKKKNRSLAY